MAIINLNAVVADGSEPLGLPGRRQVFYQPIHLPRLEVGTIHIRVVRQNGAPYDLTGATVAFTVRRSLGDATARFTRNAALTSPGQGLCTVTIESADTEGLYERKAYIYDVQLISSGGLRQQIIPQGHFRIDSIVSLPGETPLPAAPDPGGTAPSGPRGLPGSRIISGIGPPTSDDGVDDDFWVDEQNHHWYGPKAAGAWPEDYFSLDGEPGPPGAAGEDGDDGAPGPAGVDGAPGPAGVDGEPGVDGPPGAAGAAGVAGEDGAPGADGTPGVDGVDGTPGVDGANGTKIWTVAGAPSDLLGADDDFAIWPDPTTPMVYGPKAAGTWPAGIPMRGESGIAGVAGATGPAGATGATGATGAAGSPATALLWGAGAPTTQGIDGNSWFNTTTGDLYGPKAAGVWPTAPAMVLGNVANWGINLCRYFLVDPDSGSDTNVGYVDASANGVIDPTGKSIQTLTRLGEIIPRCGNGRHMVILIKPLMTAGVPNGNTISGGIDLARCFGYGQFICRGSTDLTNSVADKLMLGAMIGHAGPNVDGSFTVSTATGKLISAVQDGTFPVEPTIRGGAQTHIQGMRIRFKGNVTAALAGVTNAIYKNDATSLEYGLDITAAVNGDEFFIERPGVRIGTYTEINQARGYALNESMAVATVGIATTGISFVIGQPNVRHLYSFCEAINESSTVMRSVAGARIEVSSSWTDESTTARATGGFGLRTPCMRLRRVAEFEAQVKGLYVTGTSATVSALSSIDCEGANLVIRGSCILGGGAYLFCNSATTSGAYTVGNTGGTAHRPVRVIGAHNSGVSYTSSFALQIEGDGSLVSGVTVEKGGAQWVGLATGYSVAYARPGGKITVNGLTVAPGDAGPTYMVWFQLPSRTREIHCTNTASMGAGTTADILFSDGAATTSWANLLLTNVVDINGNNIRGTTSGANMVSSMLVNPCVLVTNQEAVPLTPGQIMRGNGVANQVLRADATTFANAAVEGVMVTGALASGGSGYMTSAPIVYIGTVAPTAGQVVWLSNTPGTATITEPTALSGTQQKVKLGRFVGSGRYVWFPDIRPESDLEAFTGNGVVEASTSTSFNQATARTIVITGTVAAALTFALPLRSTVRTGQKFRLVDQSTSGNFTLTVNRTSPDLINQVTTGTVIYAGSRKTITIENTPTAGWVTTVSDALDETTLANVAAWDISLCRYFLIDGTSGNDGNVGYVDAALGATIDPTGKAIATIARLYAILPCDGNGRFAVILFKPLTTAGVPNGNTYTNSTPFDIGGRFNYRRWILRGSTDLTNSATDKILLGAMIGCTGPNGDGSWTCTTANTNRLINAVAAGTLPAEPVPHGGANSTHIQGMRIRFKGNITAALANVVTAVYKNTTSQIELAENLAAVPADLDEFFIERPGVRFGAFADVGTAVGIRTYSTGDGGVATVGICSVSGSGINNLIGQVSVRHTYAFCEHTAEGSTNPYYAIPGARLALTSNYTDELGTLRQSGFGIRTTKFNITKAADVFVGFRGLFVSGISASATAMTSIEVMGGLLTIQGSNVLGGGVYIDCNTYDTNTANNATLGNIDATATRPTRLIGHAVANASAYTAGAYAVQWEAISGTLYGVTFEPGAAASTWVGVCVGAIKRGGSMYIRNITTAVGATAPTYMLYLTASSVACRDKKILVSHTTNTAGATSDILFSDGSATSVWGGLAQTNIVDINNNDVSATTTNMSVVKSPMLYMTNKDSVVLTQGMVMRGNGVAAQAVRALADTAANAEVIGTVATAAAVDQGFYLNPGPIVYMNIATPLAGKLAWLSTATAGTATFTEPTALSGTLVKVKLGRSMVSNWYHWNPDDRPESHLERFAGNSGMIEANISTAFNQDTAHTIIVTGVIAGNLTYTLPAASTVRVGQKFRLIDQSTSGAFTLTPLRTGADLINQAATITGLTSGQRKQMIIEKTPTAGWAAYITG